VQPAEREPADDGRDGESAQSESVAARAEAAIHAIAAGADPGAEALNVSNRFTDELTRRLSGAFRRGKRDGRSGDAE
jgi:hypothetical protein